MLLQRNDKKVQAMMEMNRKIKADICINKLINKTNPSSSLCHQQCDFRYFLFVYSGNQYLFERYTNHFQCFHCMLLCRKAVPEIKRSMEEEKKKEKKKRKEKHTYIHKHTHIHTFLFSFNSTVLSKKQQ